jgi:hypothetical protein
MPKRVAALLIGNLSEALRRQCIEAADSEPYWLHPDQYNERDGGVELLPARAREMMAYCKGKNMCPLGIVILTENGDYADYINSDNLDGDPVSLVDREFATKLVQAHAHFWFCVVPWLNSRTPSA